MPIQVQAIEAERMVRHLYMQLFDREPEAEVLAGLIGYFGQGKISARIQLMTMLKSDEFFDKRLRGKTPEQIAGDLYHFVLAREPESADALQGAANFVGNLGWQVEVDVMINSEEYLGRFGDDDLPHFVGDTVTQTGEEAGDTADLAPAVVQSESSGIHEEGLPPNSEKDHPAGGEQDQAATSEKDRQIVPDTRKIQVFDRGRVAIPPRARSAATERPRFPGSVGRSRV